MEKFRLDTKTRKVTKSTFVEVVKMLSGNPSLSLKRSPKDTVEFLNCNSRFEHSRVSDIWTVILNSKDWRLNILEGESLVFDLYSFYKQHPDVVNLSYNERYFDF